MTISKVSQEYSCIAPLAAAVPKASYPIILALVTMCSKLIVNVQNKVYSKDGLYNAVREVLVEAVVDCKENSDLISLITQVIKDSCVCLYFIILVKRSLYASNRLSTLQK